MRHGNQDYSTQSHDGAPYRRLAVMAALSFASMFVLMYAMVDRFGNVYGSVNQAYMAGLMTAPMVAIELLVMGSMYPNKRTNLAIVAVSAAMLVGLWVLIRQQVAVSDRQFLRSMIPHHAGAILMCQKAALEDARLKTLCDGIISSQQEEIDFMKAKLTESTTRRENERTDHSIR